VKAFYGTLSELDQEEPRGLWRARHEQLWRPSQRAIHDDKPGSLRAAVAVARSAAQLDGLDQPTRVELRQPDAEQFEAVVDMLVLSHRGVGADGEADIFELEESAPQ